jgi:hypothetical protein
MENAENLVPPEEQRLAAQMPDPSGPPQAARGNEAVMSALDGVGIALVAVGGLMVPLFTATTHTAGATRSAKLQWEQRQQEIRQVIEKDQAERGTP